MFIITAMKPMVRLWMNTLLCLTPLVRAAETNRLNILFCFADDWGTLCELDGGPSLNHVRNS